MKKAAAGFLALMVTAMVWAQDANTEVRNVGAFTGVKVSNGIELILKQGSDAVAVSASSTEYRDKIKTVVENGTLKIYYDNGKPWKALDKAKKSLKAYVSVSTLEKLEGNSGASVNIEGTIKTAKLDIDVNSGGSVKGAIEGSEINADLSSGGSARLKGSSDRIEVRSTSGAHFYGYELAVQDCSAEVSSGGKIEITASKELAAKASSGGAVHYKGGCTVKNVSISSGGSVKNKS